MASQWDPSNFKPLDMSKILGYPRQMPPRYEKWLPRFTGSNEENVEDHMSTNLPYCRLGLLPPYTHLGDVEEIFNPLGVSLGASES
jgi:hypothetical protein